MVRRNIQRHIAWLQKELKKLDNDLGEMIRQSPLWRTRDDLLRSVPGVGQVLSVTLLAELPELGSLDSKKIASLVGVAPLNLKRHVRGRRSIWGGRARIRRVLAWAGGDPKVGIKVYDRLCAAGKAKKTAITACMRKLLVILNSMVKHGTHWTTDQTQIGVRTADKA